MSFKGHKENFNKRFNITLLDSDPKKTFQEFKQRILNIVENISCSYIEFHPFYNNEFTESIETGIDKSIRV